MNWPLTVGATGLTGIVLISLFYLFGGVFGPLNDLSNALLAVLTAAWAWRLHAGSGAAVPAARPGWPALAAAWAGSLIAVVGSVLVLSRLTGWYLAGLVTQVGYGFIGLWLLAASQAALRGGAWPRRLARSGRAVGALMSLGVLAVPGILARADDPATAPWYANAALALGVGWFFLFPLWCLWLGRHAARPRAALPLAPTPGPSAR
jgi:hypothetical protein